MNYSDKLRDNDDGRILNWNLILRISLTLAIVAYLALKIDWSKLATQLLLANPLWLLGATVLIGATFAFASLRWWLLLRVQGINVPLKKVGALTLIGQFFNAYLLGATGGDAVKMVSILKYVPNQRTHAILSILMDRGIGLFVFLSCALIALPWQLPALTTHQDQARAVIVVLVAVFVAMIVCAAGTILVPFNKLPPIFHKLWQQVPKRHILQLFVGGVRQHLYSPRLVLSALLCALVLCLIVFLAGYCIALGIGLKATYGQMFLVLSVVTCVISLPISIGGHGVREGAFIILFEMFGLIADYDHTRAGQETAVLFSLLFFAVFLFWSLVGGIVYLSFEHSVRR